ncbi:MAG: hypothetical protein QOJ29_1819 [Thermoleophilaceae bacterium]|nr:hypothetical protein [Thermoleophilaceae bacterium]
MTVDDRLRLGPSETELHPDRQYALIVVFDLLDSLVQGERARSWAALVVAGIVQRRRGRTLIGRRWLGRRSGDAAIRIVGCRCLHGWSRNHALDRQLLHDQLLRGGRPDRVVVVPSASLRLGKGPRIGSSRAEKSKICVGSWIPDARNRERVRPGV